MHRGEGMYVRCVSDRETEGEQGKEMLLNGYDAFLSSVNKTRKCNMVGLDSVAHRHK